MKLTIAARVRPDGLACQQANVSKLILSLLSDAAPLTQAVRSHLQHSPGVLGFLRHGIRRHSDSLRNKPNSGTRANTAPCTAPWC
jgi:hypothetical protein